MIIRNIIYTYWCDVDEDKIRPKAYINLFKTAVSRVILRANDLPHVKIKSNLFFTPYLMMLDYFFDPVI